MKTIYSFLGVLLLICSSPTVSNAQLSTPDGDSIISLVALRVNGIAAHVALTEAGWYIARDGHAPDVMHRPAYLPNTLYPRKGHPDQFIQLWWKERRYKIMQVQSNAGLLQAVEAWSDSIYVPGMISGDLYRFYADEDMHAMISSQNSVYTMLSQRKLSSPNWELDTLGLGRNYGYLVSDTSGNFYVSLATHVFVKMAGTNYFTLRPPCAYGGAIIVDKNNRLYRPAGNLYKSDDAGITWDSVAPDTYVPSFIDMYGNMYGTGAGDRLGRSSDGGVTWTREDSDIITHSTDSQSVYNFLGLAGDSILYAATRWGVFVSADQGGHWQQNIAGTGSVPKGYWKYSDGREVVATQLGLFVKSAGSTTWAKKFPSDSDLFTKMGAIQADTTGNLYVLLKRPDIYSFMPMRSTDRGDSWILDTSGLAYFTTQTGLYDGKNYFITEDGTALINASWIYKRVPGGPFLVDTLGLRSNRYFSILQEFDGFATDYNGNYYIGIENRGGAPTRCVWHRSALGNAWTFDSLPGDVTSLFNQVRFTYFTADHAGSVVGCDDQHITYRQGNTWVSVPLETSIPAWCNAVGGDPSDALFSAYFWQHGQYRDVQYEGKGVFCTHDLGITWSRVPGLDSVYVKAFQTIGDTTYVLASNGLYKMTCNGAVVINNVPAVISGSQFNIYPNPATSVCTVTIREQMTENTNMVITDVTGKLIRSLAIEDSSLDFMTDDIAPGIYICTVLSGHKVIGQKKLVVSR